MNIQKEIRKTEYVNAIPMFVCLVATLVCALFFVFNPVMVHASESDAPYVRVTVRHDDVHIRGDIIDIAVPVDKSLSTDNVCLLFCDENSNVSMSYEFLSLDGQAKFEVSEHNSNIVSVDGYNHVACNCLDGISAWGVRRSACYYDASHWNGSLHRVTNNLWKIISTNMKIFDNREDAMHYLSTGEDIGSINGQILPIDMDNAIYDDTLPNPQLLFDDFNKTFTINNASPDFRIEIKGRWASVEDLETFKKNNQWYFRHHSIIQGDLTHWVTAQDGVSSEGLHAILNHYDSNPPYDLIKQGYGKDAFDEFLVQHPVAERNIQYPKWYDTIFSGMNEAKTAINQGIANPFSYYNSFEFYIRFIYVNGDTVKTGAWTHVVKNLPKNGEALCNYMYVGSGTLEQTHENILHSQNGLTDDNVIQLEDSGNSRNDSDLIKPVVDNNGNYVNGDFDYAKGVADVMYNITQVYNMNHINNFNEFLRSAFTFIPQSIWTIIITGLTITITFGIVALFVKIL